MRILDVHGTRPTKGVVTVGGQYETDTISVATLTLVTTFVTRPVMVSVLSSVAVLTTWLT